MRNIFFAGLLFSIVLSPSITTATTTSDDFVRQTLISSLTELIEKLKAELNTLIAKSSTQIKQTINKSVISPKIDDGGADNLMAGVIDVSNAFVAVKPSDLFISSISLFNTKPGDNLIIKGHGFLKANTLHIGSYYSASVSSVDNSFSINTPQLPDGIYEVWIDNANGSSRGISSNYIKISGNSESRSVIQKVYPSSVATKTKITVEGKDFDFYGNEIVSSLGTIKNISSDGKKITFYMNDFSEVKKITNSSFPHGMLSTFSVKNSKGTSINFGRLVFSSDVALTEQTFFEKVASFFGNNIKGIYKIPSALAYGRTADGDVEGTQGMDETCTCSGGTVLKFSSILDQQGGGSGGGSAGGFTGGSGVGGATGGVSGGSSGGGGQDHYYLDYPGVTTEVGYPAGGYSQGNHYLATLYPIGICMVIKGEYCENSQNNPEGTLRILGTAQPSKTGDTGVTGGVSQ